MTQTGLETQTKQGIRSREGEGGDLMRRWPLSDLVLHHLLLVTERCFAPCESCVDTGRITVL